MRKKILIIVMFFVVGTMYFTSCKKSDADTEWGFSKVYMPQANYNPYTATTVQPGATCEIDEAGNKLNVSLGVYRSGLEVLSSYTVNVIVKPASIAGKTELPSDKYSLPATVTCPDGKRDVSFYLSIDLSFLKANMGTDYTLTVSIQNPDKYELNEDLSTTNILIQPSLLFK